MSNPLIIENSIDVDASAGIIWDALVNPVQTKKYMFGCEAISDWKPGSALIWKGTFDGIELNAVKGIVLECRPGKFLAYTVIDPNGSIPDIPENYLTVTYELSEINGKTRLKVTQGDYAKVAEGEKRYQDSTNGGGWQSILVEIKKLAEGN
jgi:uncharacterized protein YndB with AHSA1/START domain